MRRWRRERAHGLGRGQGRGGGGDREGRGTWQRAHEQGKVHGWCNGHYNRSPDLGKCVMWWNVWDLARHTILDTKVLDRNVTWLTKHKDTS